MELPLSFVKRLQQELSGYADLMCSTIAGQQTSTSIRVNINKAKPSALSNLEFDEEVPWCRDAYFLKRRPSFTLDPDFHAGAYYVQEASSLVLSAVMTKLPKPARALDLCAAPGGKSLILLDSLAENGFLVANEIIPKRAQILQENIDKWGSSRVSIVSGEAKDLAKTGASFDCILVDAPCSGEGLFGKDVEAIKLWNEALPQENATRQMAILNDILPALEAGGHLIYSTCTYGKCENEGMWLWLKAQGLEPVSLDFPKEWGFIDANTIFPEVAPGKAYRALPGISKGLGFFICAFRKAGEHFQGESFIAQETSDLPLTDQLKLPAGLAIHSYKNQSYYVATLEQSALIQRLSKHVTIRKLGAEIGHVNAQMEGLVPAHGLALSVEVESAFPEFKLPHKQALWYLARKDFQPTGIPVGYFKVICNGMALGWGFNNKGRFINCFPNQLKIRMKI